MEPKIDDIHCSGSKLLTQYESFPQVLRSFIFSTVLLVKISLIHITTNSSSIHARR